jgi:hypothetical protein
LSETAHQPCQQSVRIDSAAQEQTERNIAAQTQAETFIEFCPNFVERFAIAALNLWSAAKGPIALHLRFSGTPHQVMGRRQSFDLLDHRLRSRNEAQQQISSERGGIDFPRGKVLVEERRQFRTEIQSPPGCEVIKRLLA